MIQQFLACISSALWNPAMLWMDRATTGFRLQMELFPRCYAILLVLMSLIPQQAAAKSCYPPQTIIGYNSQMELPPKSTVR